MCMCLARGTVGGEGGKWMRGLNFGFTNPLGTGGVLDVCLCFGCGGVGGVGGSGFGQGSGEWVVLCLCKLCALTFCVDEDPGTCVLCLADTKGGTRGSGIVYSAADVFWMSVMRGM